MIPEILIFFINLIFIGFLIYIIWIQTNKSSIRHIALLALGLKILAGIALGIVYQHYFKGGDTFNFHQDATLLANQFYEHPPLYFKTLFLNQFQGNAASLQFLQQPRALFFVKFLSLFNIITYHNYWLTSCYLSILSFAGFGYLVHTLCIYFPNTKPAATIAFLFVPSVVFWSSGVLKESLVLPSMCILVAFSLPFFALPKDKPVLLNSFQVIFSIILLWVLWELKYYYFGALVPILFTNIGIGFLTKYGLLLSPRAQNGWWIILYSGILAFATLAHPNLNFDHFMQSLVTNHDNILSASVWGNTVHFHKLYPSFTSLFINTPKALVAGLFRPFPWEAHTLLQLLPAFENTLLLILSVVSLIRIFRLRKVLHLPFFVYSLIFYVLFLAVLMALASPNLGSLARYKIGFLPFFSYLTLIFGLPNKLKELVERYC